MTCGWTGACHPAFRKVPSSNYQNLLPTFMINFGGNRPVLAIFRQFLDDPPMFMKNLPKKGSLSREFWPQNPPIWAAHTRTLNMLCTPFSQRRRKEDEAKPGKLTHNSPRHFPAFLGKILILPSCRILINSFYLVFKESRKPSLDSGGGLNRSTFQMSTRKVF